MNSIFHQFLLSRSAKSNKSQPSVPDPRKSLRKTVKSIREFVFIFLGVLSAVFGLQSFILPADFSDGGVTGISRLTNALTGISLSGLIVVINVPFLLLGYKQVGVTFALKALLAICALALALMLFKFPVVTDDKFLVAVFGGVFIGAGIGLSIRGGAVLDGTEIMALYLSKKTGLTVGDVILIFNLCIFFVAAYFLSTMTALYSMVTYLVASKTVDVIVSGLEEYIGVTIVSQESEKIRLCIIEKMGRGVTIYSGLKGYGKRGDSLDETHIVYTVISRLELAKLQTEIEEIDPSAFVVMTSIKDIKGGMVKKRYF